MQKGQAERRRLVLKELPGDIRVAANAREAGKPLFCTQELNRGEVGSAENFMIREVWVCKRGPAAAALPEE
eukprot:5579692-Prorocentrum_lima.AAC.1